MSFPIVLVGGGGHARVVADIIKLIGKYHIVGFTDVCEESILSIDGLTYLGKDEVLPELLKRGVSNAAIAVGFNNRLRHKLFSRCLDLGFELPVLCHPKTVVAEGSIIGSGTVVMANAVINPGVIIKENVIVNTGAIIEHDCEIGNSAQIGPGAVLCGSVKVEQEAFVGAGACIIQGITVGAGALVGAGSVIIKDVPSGATVVGNPGRIIR